MKNKFVIIMFWIGVILFLSAAGYLVYEFMDYINAAPSVKQFGIIK